MKGAYMYTRIVVLSTLLFVVVGWAYGQAPTKPDIVEVVDLRTVIYDAVAQQITTQVEKINDNPKVKAVVLLVDSPGGGASASAVIYQELSRIKVPVVGFCEYMCASGGVYALMASSVKYIGVRDDTIGGSVGVISQLARFNRLLDWAKIDIETYKSGTLKDVWNGSRAAEKSDREFLQSVVDELASKFYGVVEKSRGDKISKDNWIEIKSARIFIGQRIVKVGLADAVMTKDDAIKKAKELSGSKLIFTRDELRKMSRSAEETHSFSAPQMLTHQQPFGDIPALVEIIKEVRQGETIKFEYRMPYRF